MFLVQRRALGRELCAEELHLAVAAGEVRGEAATLHVEPGTLVAVLLFAPLHEVE